MDAPVCGFFCGDGWGNGRFFLQDFAPFGDELLWANCWHVFLRAGCEVEEYGSLLQSNAKAGTENRTRT